MTAPLIFLGAISPRYIKWVLNPKPAGHVRRVHYKNMVYSKCTIQMPTCWVTKQDPCHNDHFKGFGPFTGHYDPCCHNGDEAVPNHRLFSEKGTHFTSCLIRLYYIKTPSYLPSTPEITLTLTAPRSPPTANKETIKDQIMVTVCGDGGSPYLWYQLLLMKCCMYCRESFKMLSVAKLTEKITK